MLSRFHSSYFKSTYLISHRAASSGDFSAAFKDLRAMNTAVMTEYTKALLSSMRRFFNDFNEVFISVPVEYTIGADSGGFNLRNSEDSQVSYSNTQVFHNLIFISCLLFVTSIFFNDYL